jgi:hypothetical protein
MTVSLMPAGIWAGSDRPNTEMLNCCRTCPAVDIHVVIFALAKATTQNHIQP